MFKINSYRLFLLIALFSNSSNVACSSFRQSDNLNSVYPHTNPSRFVSHIPIHNNTNCYSLPNGLPSINTSNMQQGATHPSVMRSLVLNGPNYINVNNNNILFLIPYRWDFSSAGNTLFGANNNTVLPSILPNAADISTNMNNVVAPMPLLENRESTMPFSTHTNNNNMPLLIPDELSSSNIASSAAPYTNQDKDDTPTKKKTSYYSEHICPTCKKVLSHRGALDYHMKTHDLNRPRPFQCHLCNKSFYEKSVLKNHIKRHNKEKSFKCDYCSKCFITKYEKNMHERVHTSEKPFKCDICEKRLCSKVVLKGHLNKHRGIKPYSCEECEKSFRNKSRLNDHRRLHKEKKPYKCNLCTKAYASRGGLEYHIKMHSRPKPHICHYCNAAFALKSAYQSHIDYEESADEDLKCHLCKKVYANKATLEQHNKQFHPINS